MYLFQGMRSDDLRPVGFQETYDLSVRFPANAENEPSRPRPRLADLTGLTLRSRLDCIVWIGNIDFEKGLAATEHVLET